MALFRPITNVVIELYLLYIKLIIQHIMSLSGAQRNFPYIYVPHTQLILMSKITIMIKTFLSLNPKYDLCFSYGGGGGSWGSLTSNIGLPKF